MNLKESFRYQNFLDSMMDAASNSILNREHCLTTTETHNRSKANPDAVDTTETVESSTSFYPNDDVIAFMKWLVKQREALSVAIGKAKASLAFDMDAAIETNKFRQSLYRSIKSMMRWTPSKKTEQGRDYKFNAEGNQMPYVYDIDVVTVEAYDKGSSKKAMREAIEEADKVSAEIDSAMINTTVDYLPVFDVNDSFEDVMEEFLSMYKDNSSN